MKETGNLTENPTKFFSVSKKIYGVFIAIAVIFIVSFCVVFRSVSAIVEKSNTEAFNVLSLHDREFLELVLKTWWRDAEKIGKSMQYQGLSDIAAVKEHLQHIKNLFEYEDCMVVSETGYVFSADNAVKDVNFVVQQCKNSKSHFAVRYDFKNLQNVLLRSTYLLAGAEIEPFTVGNQTFTHFVIVRQMDSLSKILRIGDYNGKGGSTVIDSAGYYIIGDFWKDSEEENPDLNFFDEYEQKRRPFDMQTATLYRRIVADEISVFKTAFNGVETFVTVSPIADTAWKFMSYVPRDVFSGNRRKILAIYIVLVIVSMALLCVFVVYYIKKQREILIADFEHQSTLVDALSLAQQANWAKTVFLNNMSYQIRTPMNAILGFSALATTHLENAEDVKNYLGKISKSAHQLLSMINNVLDMSRIESGKMNLSETKENLADVIHSLQSSLIGDVNAKAQNFRIDAIDVVDEDIICDRMRLVQVLSNLLSNAIKYTKPRGTITMRIFETAFRREGYATYEFRIKDNGIGMSEDFQRDMFEPFRRENVPAVSASSGAGLGMAIVKNIVDMMGGEISVKSSPQLGTEVIVRLEFKVASVRKNGEIPELAHKNAIVIDSDMEMSGSLCRMLKRFSLSATFSADIDGALQYAREKKQSGTAVSLFLLGYDGSESTFFENVRKLKKNAGADGKIVVLTELDWSDVEAQAREAGVDKFVSTPLFASDFRLCLTQLFGVRRDSKRDSADLSGRMALLVEDNETSREITKLILNDAGISAVTAENGKEAVETLRQRGAGYFDFVLMDVMMPVMDGLEATRKIRSLSDKALSEIPIVAMTAKSSDDDKEEVLSAGMNAHVAKPVEIKMLLSALKSVLK